jgi:glycoside/pentoside/hexuronide:cation symporter, GPH family
VLILLFYPIDQKKHEENVARLKALEAEAKAHEVADSPIGAPAR